MCLYCSDLWIHCWLNCKKGKINSWEFWWCTSKCKHDSHKCNRCLVKNVKSLISWMEDLKRMCNLIEGNTCCARKCYIYTYCVELVQFPAFGHPLGVLEYIYQWIREDCCGYWKAVLNWYPEKPKSNSYTLNLIFTPDSILYSFL
jgi:hypothetical protein